MTDQPRFARARNARRASDDDGAVQATLEAGMVAHVGFVAEGRPMVMQMAYAAGPGRLWLHGASKARIVRFAHGAAMSATVTLVDGIVAARSGFHHSVNDRSAVVHGTGRAVIDADEAEAALHAITEHLLPGRCSEIRPMTAQERKATGVFAIEIEAASAKVRTGPPVDDTKDHALGLWGGIVPVVTGLGRGVPDGHTPDGLSEPASIARARAKTAT